MAHAPARGDRHRHELDVRRGRRQTTAARFGKWLHGPGSFRDREPERWQQLHDLHEQFHRNAAQVLDSRPPAKQDRPAERLQAAEFINVQSQLEGALQAAAVVK